MQINDIPLLFELTPQLIKLFALAVAGFGFAMALTPVYTYAAYRYRFWKKQRSTATTGELLSVFNKLHEKKFERNIPTMAGLIALVVVVIITVAANLDRQQTWLPLAAFFGGGVVGLIDDIINIRGKGGGVGGLRSSVKFALITLIALVAAWFFYTKLGYTDIHIPFVGALEIGWLIIPLFVLVVVSTSNAVNISDGLDGLATVPVMLVALSFTLISYVVGNTIFSEYLQIQYIPDVGELSIFCGSVVGACLGFLWYNAPPAKIFMGDTGSLSLGGSLAAIAIIVKHEIVLAIIGGLFVLETVSVIIQVASFKLTGKRIFKMAPIHHHFEKKGWAESTIVIRFWIIAIILALIGLATLKLR